MAFPSSPSICAACLRAAQRAAPRKPPSSSLTALRQPQYASPQGRRILHPRAFSTAAPTLTTRRAYATAAGAPTPQTPQPQPQPQAPPQSSTPQPARAILNPRTTPEGDPMIISLSPRAAHRLAAIAESDKNPSLALRVSIESGGCHGFQYLMNLVDLSASPATEEDTVFEADRGAKVVVDEASLELLSGSTVDYTMELIGSQFKVTGIPGATSSCGCGTSFDIKL